MCLHFLLLGCSSRSAFTRAPLSQLPKGIYFPTKLFFVLRLQRSLKRLQILAPIGETHTSSGSETCLSYERADEWEMLGPFVVMLRDVK